MVRDLQTLAQLAQPHPGPETGGLSGPSRGEREAEALRREGGGSGPQQKAPGPTVSPTVRTPLSTWTDRDTDGQE